MIESSCAQNGLVRYEFEAPLWTWDARRDHWTFVALPPEASEEIRGAVEGLSRGFGSVRVSAHVGSVRWRTSIFPDPARGYVLPIKRAARESVGAEAPDRIRVTLELVDL